MLVFLNSDVESLFENSYIYIVSEFKGDEKPINLNSTFWLYLAGI